MRIDPTRDLGPTLTLEQALDRDCRDYRGGLKAVCAILGEPYDGFQKRLSVSYPEHHLYLDDFERVVELVQGAAVRQWFQQLYGVVCYRPSSVEASTDTLREVARVMGCNGDFVESLVDGAADGQWDAAEVARLEQQAYALIGKLMGIVAGARQALEGQANG